MSDTEQSPVTRDDLVEVLRGTRFIATSRMERGWAKPVPEEAALIADAVLAEFTLTRKGEPAEVDPWIDPEPWVYVVTGKRAVHPLPQTYYRYAPRTHLDYDVAQRTVGK